MNDLKDEFHHYLDHQDEFVRKYDGKVIVIKDHEVIGVFDDHVTAIRATSKTHPLGTFLVQKVSPGDADTTVTFHTPRVAFSGA